VLVWAWAQALVLEWVLAWALALVLERVLAWALASAPELGLGRVWVRDKLHKSQGISLGYLHYTDCHDNMVPTVGKLLVHHKLHIPGDSSLHNCKVHKSKGMTSGLEDYTGYRDKSVPTVGKLLERH